MSETTDLSSAPAPVEPLPAPAYRSTPSPRTGRAPAFWRLAVSRGRLELKIFFRERTAVVFTFAFPVVLLLLLGPIFNRQAPAAAGISTGQLLTAGMIGSGIGATCFVNLATGIIMDREDGTLKRLRRAPMPAAAYFLGKVILVLVTSLISVALVLLIGIIAFDVALPTDPGHWLTFAWVYLLGVSASALLGIAISSLPRSTRGAAPVINLPYLVLEFISGVFIVPITSLPKPFQEAAALFPLKWLTQGFRSVFLPDSAAALEPAHSWEPGRTALVLAAWCVGGFVLCLTTFRWRGRDDG